MTKYFFVEHSKGVMDGTTYNNISLSNGLRTAVVKNETGVDDYDKTVWREGREVNVTLENKIVKGPNRTSVFAVVVTKMELVEKKQ